MSWKDVVCLLMITTGVFLFLYGSNYYNAVTGWTGVFLILGGFLVEIILKAYEVLIKKEVG